MTSHYDFYQYFMRLSDDDVARFLTAFTFLQVEQITQVWLRTGCAHQLLLTQLANQSTT
jgi:tyrosyl-tRNA synthetase